ncbi:M20 aminoacylase family protein [Verminephrobacter eiseniae]|uniref:M20 aminoacylase family protein n=1 Tax=Verminephrobacter eiseniae TaxID=364317 RepID=UPI002237CDEB|nr:M20 aminoacylase family protein [Verminephrobacter eiseniae]MCW5238244.1 amidohydrolase [Verminephrobacter eiseniae]
MNSQNFNGLEALTRLRQDIHRHPELAFEERRTAGIVAAYLRSLGIELHTEVGRTGVVGVIPGKTNRSQRSIGLRADMDALAMPDHKPVPHRSTCEGVMHGCGHDGHTAMLLGAAAELARTRAFDGTVVLIFQPAEEGAGGAKAMLDDGLLERFPVESFWGLHNWPGVPLGEAVIHNTACMAAVDYFDIDVLGKGCHGGMPQEGIDAVLAAAHIVTALQSIPARNVHPLDSAVVGVAKIHGGQAYHVGPEVVTLSGSVRAHKESVRALVEHRLHDVAENAAAALGAKVRIRYQRNYPATVNDPALADIASEVAASVLGAEKVVRDRLPSMAAEDFSFFSRERPGCYVWMGNDDADHIMSLHHPKYDFNDRLIEHGIAYWTRLVSRVLPAVPPLKAPCILRRATD